MRRGAWATAASTPSPPTTRSSPASSQASDGAFKLVEAPFSDEPYGIGLKKDDDAFRDFINDRLEEIFENGDWADAFEATLGPIGLDTPEPPEVDRYTETPPAPTTTTTAAP